MAPVCMARRPRLSDPLLLCVFLLFLSLLMNHADSLVTYDRETLLNIRLVTENLGKTNVDGQDFFPPPLLSGVSHHLDYTPTPSHKRKPFKRRGKRSRLLVKLKSYLAPSSGSNRLVSQCILTEHRPLHRRFVSCRFLEPVGTWLVPVVGWAEEIQRPRLLLPRLRRGGANPRNLRPLKQVPWMAVTGLTDPTRFALVNARTLANKTFILKDFFTSHNLDFLCVTETWLSDGELSSFSELLPPNCSYFNSPRTTGRGRGVATACKSTFHCRQLSPVTFSSFELNMFELGSSHPVLCAVIYRPPKYNRNFVNDFSEFLAEIMPKYDKVLILGDMNIHVCCPTKPLAKDFLNLLDAFNVLQSVTGPTHKYGHTLDLVLSYGLPVYNLQIYDAIFSDHMPVLFETSLPCNITTCGPPTASRMFKPSSAVQFSTAFNKAFNVDSELSACADTEELTAKFLSACQIILDTVAPLKLRRPKLKSEPWLNDITRAARRECRKAERKWEKDKLQVSYDILRDSWHKYQKIVKNQKSAYFAGVINDNCHKPRVLFSILSSVLNPPQSNCTEASAETCEAFLNFFVEKILTIRAHVLPPSYDPSVTFTPLAIFSHFEPVSLSKLGKIVTQIKSGSPSDVLPPRFFKEVWGTIGPYIQRLINSSLTLGHVPAIFKQAVVQPLLKRPGLDASLLSNFRPISKLPFVSKILEKEVCSQLQTFLQSQNIFEIFQSGFKALHSTETALLRVFNDILLTADSGNSVLLVLLDLTAAFDTVDHNILIYRLEHHVGIGGTALDWFRSYLSDRSFSVSLGEFHSSSALLPCGVPQGSILGPLLFSIYLLPLGHIIKKHKVSFHFYADDCQIYLPLKHNDLNPLRPILECLKDIRAWLALNFLNFNEKKTEVIIFGPNGPGVPPSDLGPLAWCVKSIVTNLGVKFDTALKMDKQVNTVVRKSFFQLRQLSKVKPFLFVTWREFCTHL